MTAPRTLLFSVALAAAVTTAVAPTAGARSPMSAKRLQVTIEGTQLVEWQYRTDGWPDPMRTWTKGEGGQEQHFSNAGKPLAMKLLIVRVPGHRSVSLLPVKVGQTELPGRIARAQIWDPHATPNCGGELGDCAKLQAPPALAPFDCSERPLPMIVRDLEAPGPHGADDVYLDISTEPVRPFDNCPPDQPGGAVPGGLTTVRDQAPLELRGAVPKLARLRRGASVDLKVKLQTGLNRSFRFDTSCPKLSGLGYQECTTTEVSLHVKRVR